jgi:two-component system nitrogen regulation sensor histidine kinase NtrY
VLLANRVAIDLVGAQIGEELDAAVSRQERLAPLSAFLRDVDRARVVQQTVTLRGPDDSEQEWSLVWAPLPGAGEPTALLVLEDVTEVLRGQRLLAWAEMARMIAHEIKNPLTPIRLSAEHMREVYAGDPESFGEVFESCTSNILHQVGELQEIASEFSSYSRIPRIELRPGDLTGVVAGIVDGYRAASPRGIRIDLKNRSETVRATFDAKLIGRAVRNFIENALRVTPDGGAIEVAVESADGGVRVIVADTGPGVRPGLLKRIFEPYFSTHDSGTGLGLPIARRIAEEHGGRVTARNRAEGGLEVVIWLPAPSK